MMMMMMMMMMECILRRGFVVVSDAGAVAVLSNTPLAQEEIANRVPRGRQRVIDPARDCCLVVVDRPIDDLHTRRLKKSFQQLAHHYLMYLVATECPSLALGLCVHGVSICIA